MYIITLIYSFGVGRDLTATFLRVAKNEDDAIELAKKQLLEKYGYITISHAIAFTTDYGAGF